MSEPFGGMISLAERHALVCGASAGIGRATALELAQLGARVSVLARRREVLEAFLPELRQAGAPDAGCIVADLDDRDGLAPRVRDAVASRGPVHILVHNSGGPKPGTALEATAADFDAGLTRVLHSARTLVEICLPGMRAAGWGRIVNVLSISVREPLAGLGVGNTVRGAMAAWAKTLSRELPPGITINNVLPGFTATERLAELARVTAAREGRTIADIESDWRREVPEGRLAEPREIAAVIAFLCTPAAAYVRGQSVAVDGGRMRSI